MENDDRQIGRILSRREAMAMFGMGSLAFLAACARLPETESAATIAVPTSTNVPVQVSTAATTENLSVCIVRPQQTEGPYFVDEKLNRSDIRSDPSDGVVKEGLPLLLAFRLSQIGGSACTPLAGAIVDIWHCDALGVYSDVADSRSNTVGQKFLRGYQVTDSGGIAQFTTIYPGWYQGRTVHIHFKIRASSDSGSAYEFTSQLYFDDSLSDRVFQEEPYSSKGQRSVRNDGDGIYGNGGDQLTLQLTPDDQGYSATFDIGLQMD